ncbi:MAG TPA: right-handed parallel beta-helix repeat-containing protein [Verrucomicrobiae bacterium]|nr:right-handed parallel beta-helix repeat-containing protein [Verrucomicrobiae bacterium]
MSARRIRPKPTRSKWEQVFLLREGARIVCAISLLAGCAAPMHCVAFRLETDGFHVYPGESIQDALQAAARHPVNKVVKVHAGVYRPDSKGQAFIWFNRRHDGIRLEAVGDVTLSAANSGIADKNSPGFPAVVNHVVYFGHGISSNTVIKGFRITGANGFSTQRLTKQIEPDTTVPKNLFFFTDGGAIKIFGRSYPTILEVEIVGNYTSPCGAGISVQHEGHNEGWVLIQDCVFRDNRTQVTGAALDLLAGSSARLVNSLFVGNVSNTGIDIVAKRSGEAPFTNSGAMTIFQQSRAWVENCTFTGNRNGVDDMGGKSVYTNCIFFRNVLEGGPGKRYELDLQKGGSVSRCFINGVLIDPLKVVAANDNVLDAPDPEFNRELVSESVEYRKAGYRRRPLSGLP